MLGVLVLLFGVIVGGVGLASAGIGIGIPMIPLGMYLSYRGWRIFKHEEITRNSDILNPEPIEPLENTKVGKIGLGLLLIFVGVGTSTFFIGIPILCLGVWLVYKGYITKKKLSEDNNRRIE